MTAAPPGAFLDRIAAGRELALALGQYLDQPDLLVLGLPRGGVPVAAEIARALGAPLDVMLVRKLGFPGHEELALGAIASGGVRVLNEELVSMLNSGKRIVDTLADRERVELERRERRYRGDRPPLDASGRTLILVDDGLATGATMRAAVEAARQLDPAKIIVAVPLAPAETCDRLEQVADEVICLEHPEPFLAIGAHYERFAQIEDEQVRDLLDQADRWTGRVASQRD